jgi:DNA N-6-adenine-methyltransferase (Dam)
MTDKANDRPTALEHGGDGDEWREMWARPYTPPALAHQSDLAHYNPSKGLEAIAIAEIGEKYFTRAKDADGLCRAVEAKITAIGEYVEWRDGVVKWGGKQDRGAAILPDADPGDKIVHRWRKRFCSRVEGRTVIDATKMAAALEEAQQRCLRFCEGTDTYAKATFTGKFEQYTPAPYIEAARQVLSEIDLDPASCEIAQQTVQATRYFTVADDGLQQEWHGRIWLNPPYHRALIPAFVAKLVAEIEAGHVTEAVLLTNNGTDTRWYRAAHAMCSAICFTNCTKKSRIHFTRRGGDVVNPTQGQSFFFFGQDIEKFARVFADIGLIDVPYRRALAWRREARRRTAPPR